MRIRRKKHLKERIDNLSDYLLVADYDIPNVLEAKKNKKILDFNCLFGNDNPVSLEIGCGKGGFICETAKVNKDKNFLAVELIDNVIVMASERAKQENITNVRFFNCGAEYLARYIKEKSITNIYLNFSPPFAGDRYENRRLTKAQLIEDYSYFLNDGGEIHLKTDDKQFFDYSFDNLVKAGYSVKEVGEKEGGVKTEYENKFISLGLPIYRLIAKKM